jgi:hypothetical protein
VTSVAVKANAAACDTAAAGFTAASIGVEEASTAVLTAPFLSLSPPPTPISTNEVLRTMSLRQWFVCCLLFLMAAEIDAVCL